MRVSWRLVLSVIGLLLFAAVARQSIQVNREGHHNPSRYLWWSSIRLDSDPLNKHPRTPTPCEGGKENCASWDDLPYIWVDPGTVTKTLMAFAMPAFLLSVVIVGGLGRLGINQVRSFMISMPLLIFGWFYFVGSLIDRRRWKRE